jgi:penicillin-insensitive murein endopeptidase
MGTLRLLLIALLTVAPLTAANAQALKNVTGDTVAKEAFGAAKAPANLQARVIGFYARGCLAGATALPVSGKTWQVMRLSRNRNWGHPNLITFLERFATQVPKVSDWAGIMVGDLAQPRGGPMLTGHASHQIGLDADIWLTPMPTRLLSREEREEMSAVTMLSEDKKDVNPKVWTRGHTAVIKAAAKQPEVERIFVNAAIKKAVCREAGATDRGWLAKVRPYWGHHYHFHVRLRCPADSPNCQGQTPPHEGEGCAEKDLAWWFRDSILNPKPAPPPTKPVKPKPPMKLSDLPPECSQVVISP